ncbi:MAG: hypothetical protein KF878_28225 [Planctomycetes bacterium]|nr:hypothetical protein [Planctomycetota bacterium]
MTHLEFVRERPLGGIPFAAGVLTLGATVVMGGASWAAGVEGEPATWALAVAAGVALIGVGVALFRRPHSLVLAPGEVHVAARFGAPRRWRSARLQAPASLSRVGLEVALALGVVTMIALACDRAAPAQLLLAAAFARAYANWRLAPRAVLSAGVGQPTAVVRLDGLPGAAEVLAVRSAPVPVGA